MSKEAAAKLQREQAYAEVLKGFVPQLFSHPKHLTAGAEDAGGLDEWMLTNMPADVLIPLAGLEAIAQADDRQEIHDFVNVILRGLKGIGGFSTKQGERIAIGMSGATGKKSVRRPGWGGRNITNRGWERKAEDEGAEIES
jgi:hypothetical protein